MTRFFRRLALWLAALSVAAAAQVQIHELPRDVITERLEHFSKNNAQRQAMIKSLFEQAGCKGERLTEQGVKHSRLGNVVCTLSGTGEHTIIVGAHFDCVDAGDGVADNWSGASLLPSLYETLNSRPRQHTLIFIAFTDEEQGMVGSESYAKQMSKEERGRVQAMVNLDTLGLTTTQVWINHSDPKLIQLMKKVAIALKLPVDGSNFEKVGATDSDSFSAKKIPSITLHSVTPRNFRYLHTPDDRLANINRDDYYNTYRLISVYLAYLDSALEQAAETKAGK